MDRTSALGVIHSARRISVGLVRDPAPPREQAFAALYEAEFDRVYGFVHFRTGDETTAEDIAAEVFARAWSKLRDPGNRNAAAAWLFTTARRLVIDHYRRAPIQPLGLVDEPTALPNRSPERAAVSNERLAVLRRCLTDLSDRERDVIGLRFVAQLRNREIAALVRTSEGNVAKILHRALRGLRDRLTAEGYTASDGLEGVSE
jgi:RNA polymerase sigma-70 factor, ECF subfamily